MRPTDLQRRQISRRRRAEKWDKLESDGSIEEHNCKLSFQRGGRTLAVATIGRDRESLENELAMELSKRRVLAA